MNLRIELHSGAQKQGLSALLLYLKFSYKIKTVYSSKMSLDRMRQKENVSLQIFDPLANFGSFLSEIAAQVF